MSDIDEWKGTKRQREALRERFCGRCGYCGQHLTKMHADHIEPVTRLTTDQWGRPLPPDGRRLISPERNVVGNMMPACARAISARAG